MARKSKKQASADESKLSRREKRAIKKAQKKKKKHPVIFGIFLFLFSLLWAGLLTGIIVGGSTLAYIDGVINGDSVIDLDTYKNSQSQTSFLFATKDDGTNVELLRLHGEENRIWIDYEDIPQKLQWAFICLEDKRFYEHPGVDWIRTIGVLVNPAYDGQGASTITQQLIKNLTDDNEVTYKRKFNEILRALNFERNYSKKDILEAYLNTVSLGAGCYGVKTAAETYFGKELSELTLSECATIAGITQAPYSLNPYADFEACMSRRDDCLYYMHDQGKITTKQYEAALKEEIVVQEYSEAVDSNEAEEVEIMSWYNEYVIDQVIADLQEKYGYEYNEAWRQVYYGGLNIYTAVDLDVQEKLEYIYENRIGFPDYEEPDENGEMPQSSMTILDYKGRIVALVGGADVKTANRAYNRATDARAKRQPGSSIKPLSVYAPAVELGIITNGKSTALDKAITADGETWPQNYSGDFGSGDYITIYDAVAESYNTVPARILNEQLGLTTSFKYVNEKFHLSLIEEDCTLSGLACGGTYTGVTTLEMAAAYVPFGNGGRYFEPYSYYKVTDRNGTVILDNTKNLPEQALMTSTADTMLDILTHVTTQSNGTGYGTKVDGFQTFSKSGTTSDDYDKWFCGGTPYYVTAVWYGYDYAADTSSARAKTIFSAVFDEIHEDLDSKEFSETKEEVDMLIAMNSEDAQ
ncbi:MAG: transglycosylase domain-containing protein [Acutalibacteraceae bacterium]